MITDEMAEVLSKKAVENIESINKYVLQKIGNTLKQIGKLKPSEAKELENMLKFGGDYQKIVKKLTQITKMNKKEIEKILDKTAKKDYEFAKQFYQYRNKPYLSLEENVALKNQIEAVKYQTLETYENLSRTRAIGFGFKNEKGKFIFKTLKATYNDVIDEGLFAITQGTQTYDEVVTNIIKRLGHGLKVAYEYTDKDGKKKIRIRRLDSAVEMNIRDGIRQIHNEGQKVIGEQIGYDGVEITVHNNPAPDHALVQGRQFTIEEFEKFQNDEDATSVDGILFESDYNGHDRRSISQYNCYHTINTIIIGVNKPQYTNEELQAIIDINNTGFNFEGKHYSMYDGTQLQRKIETAIRNEKDTQILALASGRYDEVEKAQNKIRLLNSKYKKLSLASSLPLHKDRMKVTGYKRVSIPKTIIKPPKEIKLHKITLEEIKDKDSVFVSKEEQESLINHYINYYQERKNRRDIISNYETERYERFLRIKQKGFRDEEIKLKNKFECNRLLDYVNAELVDTEIEQLDEKIVQSITKQVYNLAQKSPSIQHGLDMNRLWIRAEDLAHTGEYRMGQIKFNIREFKNYDDVIKAVKEMEDINWWSQVDDGYEQYHTITHEFGHFFHDELVGTARMHREKPISKSFDYFFKKYGEVGSNNVKYISFDYKKEIEKDFIYEPIRRLALKENTTEEEIIKKYVSKYGIGNIGDMFAEVFTNSQLGKSNALGDELIKFLKELGEWYE